jgi:cryptochrome
MSEMGYSEATTTIKGGTSEGHRRLEAFLRNSEAVATFSKPLTAPTSLEPSTTLLSPFLKFGCVGVREVWWGSKRVIEEWRKGNAKGKGKETKEPENMFGQVSEAWLE